MKSFQDFRLELEKEEDELVVRGLAESFCYQEEYNNTLTYDRHAECYAKYLLENKIFHAYIGIEKFSDDSLVIVQIHNGEVLYNSDSPLKEKGIKLL
jgi:hypothetical protein